jgi:alkylated DNA nucleotide flippase Atl1
MKKTWFQKMEDKHGYPKILILEEKFPCYNAVHKMGANVGDEIVITQTSELIPLMAAVPKGRLVTLRELCLSLAKKHDVQGCCTLTTGIFTMTLANAVEEVKTSGEAPEWVHIPWWRTLKMEGFLNDKYPGGQEKQKKLLELEGITINSRGKKFQVKDWEQYLYSFG